VKRLLVITSILVLLILISVTGWLLASSKGNHLMLQWLAGETIQVGSFKGSLWSRMQLHDLQYRDNHQKLTIQSLLIDWQPASVFSRLLHIKELQASHIVYSSTAQQHKQPLSVPEIPLNLQFDAVKLDSLSLSTGDDTTRVNSMAFKATSQADTVRLSDIVVAYQDQQFQADSEIRLQHQLPFSASIRWQGVIPEIGQASGTSEVSGNLDEIQFKLVTETPARIETQGQVSLQQDTPVLSAQGHWQQLQWPLTENPTITSEAGSFTLSGPWQKPAITINSLFRFPQENLPSLQTHLAGKLTSSGIDQLQAEFQTLKGKIHSDGNLRWAPDLKWDLLVNIRNIDTSDVFRDWPARLNLKATLQGGITQGDLWLDTDLQQLDGTLHGYPLKAKGNTRFANKTLDIRSLNITNGPNSVIAEGKISHQLDIGYTLNAPNLAASWPAMSGQLTAKGRLGGKLADPAITANISASMLSYEQHQVDHLQANLVWQQNQAEGHLQASEFSLPGLRGKQLLVQVNGTPQQHDIQISLDASELQLEAVAHGSWQAPLWRGAIEQLQIEQETAGLWSNSQPLKLQASTDTVRLEHSCFQQQQARLCTTLQWQPTVSSIEAQLEDLPLRPLLRQLAPEANIKGLVQGTLKLNGPLDALQGTARIELPAGQVMLETEEDELPITLKDGVVNLSLTSSGHSAELKLIAGEADINAQVKTGPFSTTQPVSLNGSILAQIPQLSQLKLFMPALTDVQGNLQLQASLSGTTHKPVINGLLKIQEARANVPQLGLNLKNISLSAKNRDNEHIDLKGEVSSGDSKLHLDGNLLLDQSLGWPMQLKVSGQDVQLARLPEVQIIASPQLDINIQRQQIDIRGKVNVPKATIEIKELPRQAITTSEDEVIIGQTQQETAAPVYRNINTDIDITLGKQVSFKGFGLNTGFQGGLHLYSQEHKTLASGELSLQDGKFKAYGQDLSISQGRLLFNGSPQNPEIDIKATRLSRDETVTAILNVSGSLRKPLVTVSSTPSLPEEEALAYLLTGRGLDEEGPDKITMLRLAAASQGLEKSQEILDRLAADTGIDDISLQEGSSLEETSLLLGKYLSPDLYVSYVMGLFDTQGAFMTRYRLSKRLRLEVQSGTEQSMDLIYRVEK